MTTVAAFKKDPECLIAHPNTGALFLTTGLGVLIFVSLSALSDLNIK